MDERTEAIRILERARDLLAEQLSERVAHSRDEIFDDALGLSYLSEIGSIYEQLGQRLQQVNNMLANLPRPKSSDATREQSEDDTSSASSRLPIMRSSNRKTTSRRCPPHPIQGWPPR